MALDTYREIWNRVLLRCPGISPKLSQDFVTNAFRRLAEVRRWSWLVRYGQFIAPNAVSTGTATVTNNSPTVTGTNTLWTSAMIGRQFRVGLAAPIYTIFSVQSATQLTLDFPFGGPTASNAGYSIYQCFFTVPDDFHQFICLWDPAFNWQLHLDINQSEINIWDAQRANSGNAYVVSFRDYTQERTGTIENAVNDGTGADPVMSGTYTGTTASMFVIEVVVGGFSGTATFRWRKDTGAFSSTITTSTTPILMQEGVMVEWPNGSTLYTTGDTFGVCVTPQTSGGLPRYELWPHQQAEHVYPFLYEARATDLKDTGAALPRYIRGDVLLEMALEDVCLWPGPSIDKPNPYYSLPGANYHHNRLTNREGKGFLDVLEVQDDNVWTQNISYAYPAMAWMYATPLLDSRWLQSHAI